jgi:RNA polymerase sigma-70 factor (ECF subfamily)
MCVFEWSAIGGGLPVSETFDEFYAAHFGSLVVQLRAGTGSLAEAQDAVQEAFCRAWSRWDRLAEYDDPLAWVRRVAWNISISRWRRGQTAHRFALRQRVEHVDGPNPDRVDLLSALGHLPVNQRRAVVLFYLADLTTADIAQDCRVPESTVRSWLRRARLALLEQLGGPLEEVDRGSVR